MTKNDDKFKFKKKKTDTVSFQIGDDSSEIKHKNALGSFHTRNKFEHIPKIPKRIDIHLRG